MKNVIVKPIKGTENPADLGTKALSRDKIRKYMKALGYKGEFVEEEESKPGKTGQTKSISVGMIAKIVAVLMSEGFSVEAAKVGFKRSTPWTSGFFLLALVCMFVVAVVSMKCLSAAVSAQAEELGKEEKEKEKKRKVGVSKRGRQSQSLRSSAQRLCSAELRSSGRWRCNQKSNENNSWQQQVELQI